MNRKSDSHQDAIRVSSLQIFRVRISLGLLALLTPALVAPAPAAEAKSWESLGQLSPGTPIEVIVGGHSSRGKFVSTSAEQLTIRTATGEMSFPRLDIVRVKSRAGSRRLRNALIGVGVGAAIGLITDQTLGQYFRNESNPASARPLIWSVPIGIGAAAGAAIPSYRTLYKR
jgi:hypothetical protein